MDMSTSKRPIDDMFKNDLNLHNFTKMALPEHGIGIGIADPLLVRRANEEYGSTGNRNQLLS